MDSVEAPVTAVFVYGTEWFVTNYIKGQRGIALFLKQQQNDMISFLFSYFVISYTGENNHNQNVF